MWLPESLSQQAPLKPAHFQIFLYQSSPISTGKKFRVILDPLPYELITNPNAHKIASGLQASVLVEGFPPYEE